jgi:hypothetical protein
MPSAIYEHLGSRQFSRLIYGAIVGLGLIVALEHEEPGAAVMAGTLVGTGIAIGLTELYSELGVRGARPGTARYRSYELSPDPLSRLTSRVIGPEQLAATVRVEAGAAAAAQLARARAGVRRGGSQAGRSRNGVRD